jgi:hypothetical protein
LALAWRSRVSVGIRQEADFLAHRRAPSRGGFVRFLLAFGRGIWPLRLLQGTIGRRLLDR